MSAVSGPPEHLDTRDLVLVELVNRVLDRGVMVAGDVTISVAGVDLVHLALRLRLSSSETIRRHEIEIEAREASPRVGAAEHGRAAPAPAPRRDAT